MRKNFLYLDLTNKEVNRRPGNSLPGRERSHRGPEAICWVCFGRYSSAGWESDLRAALQLADLIADLKLQYTQVSDELTGAQVSSSGL